MLFCLIQASSSPNPSDHAMTIATWVIAISTLAYFATTLGLWLTTRKSVKLTMKIFEESNRPIVGAIQAERKPDVYSPHLNISYAITYVNAGNKPAHSVRKSLDLVVDGFVWPADIREEEPTEVLLPNYPYVEERVIGSQSQVRSLERARTLSLIFRCTYKGASGSEYGYEQKYDRNAQDGFTPVRGTAT
jgi:hypothetical protein